MHYKTLIFTAGIVVGISVGSVSLFSTEVAIFAILISFVQGGIYMTERTRRTHSLAISYCIFLFCIGTVLGVLRVQLVEEKNQFVCVGGCTFDAEIISSAETKDVYQTFNIRPLEAHSLVYDVQVRAPLYPHYEIGDTLRLSGKVTIPKALPPHGEKKSFDYVSYLHTRNVGSEIVFPKVEVVDQSAHTVTATLGRWKKNMIIQLNTYVSSPASLLASGMLFGNSSLSKEDIQTFRTAGLSHIIVLSGFNIAILITCILFVFAFIPVVLRLVLAGFFVILFVMMVGAEASVIRATAMAFVALLSTLVGREYVARQALIISFLLIILYDPSSLLSDVSLHLSFLATAGIVYGSEPVKKVLARYMSHARLVETLATTLAAYVSTLPYVMYTFGTVSVYALIANVLALPFVPIAMLVSSIVVTTSYVSSTLAMMFGYADSLLVDCILFIARAVSRLPFSNLTLSISFVGMCMLYLFVSFLILYFSHKEDNETFQTTEEGYLTGTISY